MPRHDRAHGVHFTKRSSGLRNRKRGGSAMKRLRDSKSK